MMNRKRRTERFFKNTRSCGSKFRQAIRDNSEHRGGASAPYSENVVSELLNTADERMYENKLMRKKKGYDIQSYHCLG